MINVIYFMILLYNNMNHKCITNGLKGVTVKPMGYDNY